MLSCCFLFAYKKASTEIGWFLRLASWMSSRTQSILLLARYRTENIRLCVRQRIEKNSFHFGHGWRGNSGTRWRISRISLCEALDCDLRHLPQVDYCFPQIVGKSGGSPYSIQIGPESQTKFFWEILDHKSLEINESPLWVGHGGPVRKRNSANSVSCGGQDLILINGWSNHEIKDCNPGQSIWWRDLNAPHVQPGPTKASFGFGF